MYNFRYDYTIYPDNSTEKFKETCKKIERKYTNVNLSLFMMIITLVLYL